MLRITIEEQGNAELKMVLEGRVTGPWAEELDRVWAEMAPTLGEKRLLIDLRSVTYADAGGKGVLSKIFSQTGAELITGTLSTQDLAKELIKQTQRV
jgi:anti-anti-sigma regulatory factor